MPQRVLWAGLLLLCAVVAQADEAVVLVPRSLEGDPTASGPTASLLASALASRGIITEPPAAYAQMLAEEGGEGRCSEPCLRRLSKKLARSGGTRLLVVWTSRALGWTAVRVEYWPPGGEPFSVGATVAAGGDFAEVAPRLADRVLARLRGESGTLQVEGRDQVLWIEGRRIGELPVQVQVAPGGVVVRADGGDRAGAQRWLRLNPGDVVRISFGRPRSPRTVWWRRPWVWVIGAVLLGGSALAGRQVWADDVHTTVVVE